MGALKAIRIAEEIVRVEVYKPGPQSVIEKAEAEAEAAELTRKEIAGESISRAEKEAVESKLSIAERAPKRYEVFLKQLHKNLLAAAKEDREDLKLKREKLRPKEAQMKESLRKKLGAIMLEAQVTFNALRGDVYFVDLLKEVSHFFEGHFPEGQDHASEYKNLADQVAVESKKILEDSVISQGAELDRLININETKDINLEVEEILTRAREDAALAAASK